MAWAAMLPSLIKMGQESARNTAGGIGGLFQGFASAKGYGDLSSALQQSIQMMEQGKQQGISYLDPYAKAGQASLSPYMKDVALLQDPEAARNFFTKGYSTSPEAKMELDTGTRAATQGATQSGMAGSGAQQAALQKYGQDTRSADIDKYLGQQEGIFGQGMSGLQSLIGTGEQAGGSIAQLIAQITQSQAEAEGGIGEAQLGGAQAKGGGIASFISGLAG